MNKDYNKLPEESAKAFEGFTTYLSMGSGRSLQKAADQLGKSKDLLERWSSKYFWVERCAIFDKEREMELLDDLKEVARKANLEHVKLAQEMVALGMARFKMIDKNNFRKSEIPIYEARLLVQTGVQMERDGLGIADQIKVDLQSGGKAITGVVVEIIEPKIREKKKSKARKSDGH